MPWTTDFEPGPPPDAPAKDILLALHEIADEVGDGPIWFSELSESQQLAVLRYHCVEGGWRRRWPAVARLFRRGGSTPLVVQVPSGPPVVSAGLARALLDMVMDAADRAGLLDGPEVEDVQ